VFIAASLLASFSVVPPITLAMVERPAADLAPGIGDAYCAAKAALWAQTDSVRGELASRGVTVTALHVGYMDTDMISDLSVAKNDPGLIAAAALDGVATAAREVLADDLTRQIRASLGRDQAHLATN
jgi:NAD(P)-dependent dehydrogenase (short-subunit alcohol dehydrogenase family)